MYGTVKKMLPDVQFIIVHKESTQWHLYKYCGICFKTFLFNKNAYMQVSLNNFFMCVVWQEGSNIRIFVFSRQKIYINLTT